jgi:hypothetical protein
MYLNIGDKVVNQHGLVGEVVETLHGASNYVDIRDQYDGTNLSVHVETGWNVWKTVKWEHVVEDGHIRVTFDIEAKAYTQLMREIKKNILLDRYHGAEHAVAVATVMAVGTTSKHIMTSEDIK